MLAAPSPSSGLPTDAKGYADVSTDTRSSRVAQGNLTGPTPQKPTTRREFELALRSLGFSKREAKAIAARGFHLETIEAEPTEDMTELAALLRQNVALLERQL
jgi:hypothetical protein